LNTEVDFTRGSEQFAFVSRELRSIDRRETPFAIVVGHRPGLVDSSFGAEAPFFANPNDPDASDSSDVGVALALQEHLWPVFVEHRVQLVAAGHDHAYQRHCAFAGTSAPNRETYFSAEGCASFSAASGSPAEDAYASAPERSPGVSGNGNVSVYDQPNAPVSLVVGTGGAGFTRHDRGAAFTEKLSYAFGYLRVTAESATRIRGRFVSANDDVLDEFVIVVRGEGDGEGEGVGRSAAAPVARSPNVPRRAGNGAVALE
jgi:hypothetical protein